MKSVNYSVALISILMCSTTQINAKDTSYISLKVGGSSLSSKTSIKESVLLSEYTLDSEGNHYDESSYANGTSYKFSNRNTKFTGSIAYGLDFSKISNIPIRSEIEYTKFGNISNEKIYTIVDTDENTGKEEVDSFKYKNSLKSQTFFLNNYFDFQNTTKFTPYISAGLGIALNKSTIQRSYNNNHISTEKMNSNNFAWNVGTGITYEVMPNVLLDLSYRFINAGKITGSHRMVEHDVYDNGIGDQTFGTDTNTSEYKTTLKSHNLMFGFRHTF